ncbi:MAG: PhnD/SsuA/transferrin family substrate-binding protein [Rhodobacteraceae bacterium]|nr:PhnD/SsuA/transferrin family substrate-binding protein [Paracoccaceae bacterium]
MTGIAALQMYDFPEIRENTDRFWQLIRAELSESGITCPQSLTRDQNAADIWRDDNLLFSQTCGLPYIRGLTGQAVLLGTPDYGLIPDQPGQYYSVVIVSKNTPRQTLAEMRNSVFAYNDTGSQSGAFAIFDTLFEQFGDMQFFGSCVASGSHLASVQMVASGQADIAAIDAVSWRYLEQFQNDTRHVRMFATTRPAPGLPYITGKNQNTAAISHAVERAIAALSEQDRAALGIKGFWWSKREDYQVLASRAARVSGLIKKHGLGN